MSVIVLPDTLHADDPQGLHANWGMIRERIAKAPELVKAVKDVLMHEHYKHPDAPRRDLPSDMAHAEACFADGVHQGIALAFKALTDEAYIAQQRGIVLDWITKSKKERESDEFGA